MNKQKLLDEFYKNHDKSQYQIIEEKDEGLIMTGGIYICFDGNGNLRVIQPKYLWIRNEISPPQLSENEIIGPPVQSTWRDPLSKSNVRHEGYSEKELEDQGKVGIYGPLSRH